MQSKEKFLQIANGLHKLGLELAHETQRTTELLKASIALESYGHIKQTYGSNFLKWIVYTKTTKQEFDKMLKEAVLRYDGNTLDIQFGSKYLMYIDSMYFEDWCGAVDYAYDNHNGIGHTMIVSASEYLKDNWEKHAIDFVLDNLQHIEIEDEEIEDIRKEELL